MATALSLMPHPVSEAWGLDSRGFWTKRKKTALSMLAVLSLLAGVAIAFKLFDQEVPNNVIRDASNFDYAVEVWRSPGSNLPAAWLPAGGGPAQVPVFPIGPSQFPGESRSESVRVRNTNANPARDASLFVYVDPASIEVRQWCTNCTPFASDHPLARRFLSLWTISVTREKVLSLAGLNLNENDHSLSNPPLDLQDHDRSRFGQSTQVCGGGLLEINKQAPCELGVIRKLGSAELGADGTLQPTDTRWFKFSMAETDDGTDQSSFRGWNVTFTLVFQARVPALTGSTALIAER